MARRALALGAPERALESLGDPSVGHGPRAEALRRQALLELGHLATRRASAGREGSAGRMLAVLAAEDLEQAKACRERIGWVLEARSGETLGRGSALESLRRVEPGGSAPERYEKGGAPVTGAVDERLVRMTVDDGGEWLLVTQLPARIGHERAGRAELPFVADVGIEHARFERSESLRGGVQWSLAPLGSERVAVDGAAIVAPARLAPGARLAFGDNLSMRFDLVGESDCAILRLERGAECLGASGILLVGRGRVRVGPGSQCHVRVAAMAQGVEILRDGDGLELRRVDPATGAALDAGQRVPNPPLERVALSVPRRGEGAPLGLVLSSVEVLPGRGGPQ